MSRVCEGNTEEDTITILNLIESTAYIENYISVNQKRWLRTEAYYGNIRLSYKGTSAQLKSIVNRNVTAGIVRIRSTGFGPVVVMTSLGKEIAGMMPEEK